MTFTPQKDVMDCGPACLAMVCSHYGKKFGLQYLRDQSFITREGVSMLGISEAAEKIGFKTIAAKLKPEDLNKDLLPCILHWNQNHFVVLYKIKKYPKILTFLRNLVQFSKNSTENPAKNSAQTGERTKPPLLGRGGLGVRTQPKERTKPPLLGRGGLGVRIADPGHGFVSLSEEKFRKSWISDGEKGVALFLEPTEKFFAQTPPPEEKITLKYILKYLHPYKWQLAAMFLLLLLGSALTLVFPFLTQALIDDGVNAKNLNFIWIILLAQLGLFLGT
ncbi:MAG: hypothetical protein LBE36_08135, partial [Flavobacteriaceae bacterium]|nr:hypothetical protein [Flavobacteriaceae bacterium]